MCVPYRTEVRHKYAYKFTSSYRSVSNDSGLDYTKVVIVSDVNSHYLSTVHAVVDVDEYKETRNNINIIVHDVSQYIGISVKDVVGVLTDIIGVVLSVATYYRNNKKEDSSKTPDKHNES